MHTIIKGNFLDLDDICVVSEIKPVGNEGCRLFTITYKNGMVLEFFYAQYFTEDVGVNKGNFNFGTYAFFDNAHKDIFKILTYATKSN